KAEGPKSRAGAVTRGGARSPGSDDEGLAGGADLARRRPACLQDALAALLAAQLDGRAHVPVPLELFLVLPRRQHRCAPRNALEISLNSPIRPKFDRIVAADKRRRRAGCGDTRHASAQHRVQELPVGVRAQGPFPRPPPSPSPASVAATAGAINLP